MIYGAGAAGLVATAWNNYGVTLSLIEAEQARQSFLARYATYADWMRRNHLQCTAMGVIKIGRLGRVIQAAWEKSTSAINGSPRFHADDDEHGDMDAADAFNGNGETLKYTLCCNAPIQGACADASMLALTKVDAALQRAGIVGGPVLFVHDEIVLEVADQHAERACRILADCMVQAFAETFPGAPLNDVVSTGIGETWGGAKP
jgi:DNA polymerase-1